MHLEKQEAPVCHDLTLHVLQTCFDVNGSREYVTNSHCISKIFVANRMISSYSNLYSSREFVFFQNIIYDSQFLFESRIFSTTYTQRILNVYSPLNYQM